MPSKPSESESATLFALTTKPASALDVHFSSESAEHYTPLRILDAVTACLTAIDLDPCSNAVGAPHVPAARHFTKAEDGLSRPWKGRVFMNPPYGREIDSWVRKLVEEYRAGRVSEAIALVPGRLDTAWFARLDDCLFCAVRGRLTFVGNRASAPFPSVLFYLGRNPLGFVRAFRAIGSIWRPFDSRAALPLAEPLLEEALK